MKSRRRQLAATLLLLCTAGASPARTAGVPPAVARASRPRNNESPVARPTPAGQGEPHPVRTHFVLDRWLTALGGRGKLAAVRSMYVKAILVNSGQIGTLENWQTAEGKYKATVSLGDHEFTTVCDGQAGWAAGDGGPAEDLVGNPLAAAVTRSYLGSYSQFFPDRRPGSVEWVREDSDAFVIRLLPAGGLPITFYLDKDTGLPLRHEMVDGERTLTFFYLEWKDYNGLKAMQRGRQTSGPNSPDLTVTAQDISWNPALDPRIFQKPQP